MLLGLAEAAFDGVVGFDAEVVELVDGYFHGAADRWFHVLGRFVGFFDGEDAAVGPGALGDGGDGFAEVFGGDHQDLAARADGAHHASGADVGGVRVGDEDVELEHGGLHGDVGVLPAFEAVDDHVAALGRRRNHVELFALGLHFGLLGGGVLLGCRRGNRGQRRRVAACECESEEDGEARQQAERAGSHANKHIKPLSWLRNVFWWGKQLCSKPCGPRSG